MRSLPRPELGWHPSARPVTLRLSEGAMNLYRYVGPRAIAERAAGQPAGTPIHSPADVLRWVRETGQTNPVICTFVVDAGGVLRVADRHSEHVACAGGGPVQSAGEMTFRVMGAMVEVVAVSNQSTGYCPEPESWPAVEAALARAGLESPAGFDPACVFRRCPACGTKNLVKGGVFECGACSADLPAEYNCQS